VYIVNVLGRGSLVRETLYLEVFDLNKKKKWKTPGIENNESSCI